MSATAITLTLLLTASSMQRDRVSSLGQGTSTLTSLSYLFQGLPDGVGPWGFSYNDKNRLTLENYLKDLLDKPAKHQLQLRNTALFLANRIYVDKRSNAYLVLTRKDSLNVRGELYFEDKRLLSDKDKLLVRTIETYSNLIRSREEAGYPWPKPKDWLETLVKKNVDSVVKKLSIVQTIKESWDHPGIYR